MPISKEDIAQKFGAQLEKIHTRSCSPAFQRRHLVHRNGDDEAGSTLSEQHGIQTP